jgi:hypothetical protein
MSDNYERLRKWAKDAASGKTDKIPYIDITGLIDEVVALRAAQPVVLSDREIDEIAEATIKFVTGERISYGQARAFARAIESAILAAKEQA